LEFPALGIPHRNQVLLFEVESSDMELLAVTSPLGLTEFVLVCVSRGENGMFTLLFDVNFRATFAQNFNKFRANLLQ
jgi:hypothetical protein